MPCCCQRTACWYCQDKLISNSNAIIATNTQEGYLAALLLDTGHGSATCSMHAPLCTSRYVRQPPGILLCCSCWLFCCFRCCSPGMAMQPMPASLHWQPAGHVGGLLTSAFLQQVPKVHVLLVPTHLSSVLMLGQSSLRGMLQLMPPMLRACAAEAAHASATMARTRLWRRAMLRCR
jgi:hypothetical protein